MSNSRDSSPDTIDIEIDPVSLETNTASRNVRQRLSPIPGDPYLGEPSHIAEHSDSSSEPFEDEDTIPLSVHLRSPSPLPSTSLPSPLPPVSPPSPVAGPSSLPGPSAPNAPLSPVLPSLGFPTSNQGVTSRWDWMPTILRARRDAEQLSVIPTPYGLRTPTLPLTGAPIHYSLPVVVSRLRAHDEHLEELDTALETLPTRIEAVEEQAERGEADIQELRDDLVETHTRGYQTQDEVAILRQETTDLRQEVTMLRQELADIRARIDQPRADAPSS